MPEKWKSTLNKVKHVGSVFRDFSKNIIAKNSWLVS